MSEADYARLEARVKKILDQKQPFERLSVPKEVALEMFKVWMVGLAFVNIITVPRIISRPFFVCMRVWQL